MSSYDIVHITTVHPRSDVRVAVKEVSSINTAGKWNVGLVVADGLGRSVDDKYCFSVEDVGVPPGGRVGRLLLGSWRVFRSILLFRPRVVHFHDPELILLGLVLKLFGYKVVYDVHEDVPRQILDKHWLPKFTRPLVSVLVEAIEVFASRIFDNIVAATPKIGVRFPKSKTLVIQNYPRLDECDVSKSISYGDHSHSFAYVGGITNGRGVNEMVEAINLVPEKYGCRLELAGLFKEPDLYEQVQSMPGWSQVQYHGWASRVEVMEILSDVRAGLLVLHPFQNHLDSYPNKLFEYMACGLPVIASDFPLWRKIISNVNCGVFVDPLNPEEIADAMQWMLENPQQAELMGERGKQAVEKIYNWKIEEKKLIQFYELLLDNDISS